MTKTLKIPENYRVLNYRIMHLNFFIRNHINKFKNMNCKDQIRGNL